MSDKSQNSDGVDGMLTSILLKTLRSSWGRRMWKIIAKKLNVSQQAIDILRMDLLLQTRTQDEVIESVIMDWMIRRKSEATLTAFENVLQEVGIMSNLSQPSMTLGAASEWKNLSQAARGELLPKEVLFCGNKKRLLDIGYGLHEADFAKILENSVKDGTLLELAFGSNLEIVTCSIPKNLQYYIPRKLSSRTRLNPKLLEEMCTDVFVVRGIDRSTLASLAGCQLTDVSGNQLKAITANFIQLENESHLDRIFESCKRPVHVVEYANGNLSWVKSSGVSSVILESLSGEYETIEENKLVYGRYRTHDASFMCISGSPGVGKTTLLAGIARRVQITYPERVVIFYAATELVDLFYKKRETGKNLALIEALAHGLAANQLGYELLVKILSSEHYKVEMFVDGLDEVFAGLDRLSMIVSELNKFQNFRVLATTNEFLYQIDKTLKPIHFKIQPMSKSNQIQLLMDMWVAKSADRSDKLKRIAESLLMQHTESMESESQIAGIPLQCYMIAEIYSQMAISASQGHITSTKTTVNIDQNVNLVALYEHLFKDTILAKHTNGGKHFRNYVFVALKQLLPDLSSETSEITDFRYSTVSESNEYNNFTIRKWPGNELFSHMTFTEFLIAEYVVDAFQNDVVLCAKIIQAVLKVRYNSTFRHYNLCYFLNKLILDRKVLSSKNIATLSETITKQWENNAIEQIFTVCVANQFDGIFCLLLESKKHIFGALQIPDIKWHQILRIATKCASFEVIKQLVELHYNNTESELTQHDLNAKLEQWKLHNVYLTPIHIAAQRGCFEIFEFFVKRFNANLTNLSGLVHALVHNTIENCDETVKSKIQILKFVLIKINTQLLNERIERNLTPLLMDRIHIQLIEEMLKEGADPNACCSNLFTVAHNAATYMNSYTFCTLVQLLFRHESESIFAAKNCNSETPIQLALRLSKASTLTVDLFASIMADQIETEISFRDSLLYHLIKNNYQEDYLRIAMKYSSKWIQFRYWDDSTTLLHQAVYWGNVNAVSYFLSIGADPNCVDIERKTPLHTACERQSVAAICKKMLEIIDTLINNGADVNALDKYGRTAFSYIINM